MKPTTIKNLEDELARLRQEGRLEPEVLDLITKALNDLKRELAQPRYAR